MALSTITLKAGSAAIAKDDLVQIAESGKIWPVKSKRFAASSGENLKVDLLINNNLSQANQNYECLCFNETTLEKFVLSPISEATTDNRGLILKVIDDSLKLTLETIVVADLIIIQAKPMMKMLSNGNLLLIWKEAGENYYAIYDQALNVVFSKTSLGTNIIESVAVKSNNGFAILIRSGDDLSLTIYTNLGTVSTASAVIATTTDATAHASAIAELSNGKFVIVIRSGTFNVQQAIYSSAGVAEGAFTNIVGITGGSDTRLSISVMAGYYCVLSEVTNQVHAAVFNNAGTILNYTTGFFVIPSLSEVTTRDSIVLNDGTYFWIARFTRALLETNSYIGLVRLAKDGVNANNKTYKYSFTNLVVVQSDTLGKTDVAGFYKNNTLVFQYESNTMILQLSASSPKKVAYHPQSHEYSSALVPAHDATMFYLARASGSLDLVEYKYAYTGIVGVALHDVAAGNEDAPVKINITPGPLNCNTLLGNDVTYSQTNGTYLYDLGRHGHMFDNLIIMNTSPTSSP